MSLELVTAVWRDSTAEHANGPKDFEDHASKVPPIGVRVPRRLDQDLGRSEGDGLDIFAKMLSGLA